jgi:hypothetical protein
MACHRNRELRAELRRPNTVVIGFALTAMGAIPATAREFVNR